jgi:hypothetical protein
MVGAIVGMIPMIAGAAIVPGWTVLMLIVLQRRDAVRAGSFLLGGVLVARAIQGVAFGWLFASVSSGNHENTGDLVSWTKVIVGLLMLISAVRLAARVPDHDAPPDKLLGRAKSVSPWALAGVGVFLVLVGTRQWIFAMGALGVVTTSEVGPLAEDVLYGVYVLAASLPLIVPLAIAISGSESGRRTLDRTALLLQRHERVIVTVVSAVLGGYFLVQGIRELT